MIGEKVITILFLCFVTFALFLEFGARTCPQDLWLFPISETRQNFSLRTQCEIHSGNQASLVNRAHAKRP